MKTGSGIRKCFCHRYSTIALDAIVFFWSFCPCDHRCGNPDHSQLGCPLSSDDPSLEGQQWSPNHQIQFPILDLQPPGSLCFSTGSKQSPQGGNMGLGMMEGRQIFKETAIWTLNIRREKSRKPELVPRWRKKSMTKTPYLKLDTQREECESQCWAGGGCSLPFLSGVRTDLDESIAVQKESIMWASDVSYMFK